ncbi:hypothetical protein L873DRAFT_653114 [Choiromyces venosus 120613-1]|uniref:Uncharacterized protein n=1 Tax=Choiromyces venosus 120613-1 TaxID=1336337 RepID=A0A3N4IU29_9PEZI|nr:hypothetical protein L873DRAFT_653114 [Choiromyces venosus 120613-1]
MSTMPKGRSQRKKSPETAPQGRSGKGSSSRGRFNDGIRSAPTFTSLNMPQSEAGPSGSSTIQWNNSQPGGQKPRVREEAQKSNVEEEEEEGSDQDSQQDSDEEMADITEKRWVNTAEPTESLLSSGRPPRAKSYHKGDTLSYVHTVATYSPAELPPRRTSSKRKDGTEKRTLHRFTNEEHRFIWFYRHDLGASRGDVYVHFNEYFGHQLRKDSIANTYERLCKKRPVDICEAQHTEPWAVGENYEPGGASAQDAITVSDGESTDYHTEGSSEMYSDEEFYTPTPVSKGKESATGFTKPEDKVSAFGPPTQTTQQSTGSSFVTAGGQHITKQYLDSQHLYAPTIASGSSSHPGIGGSAYHQGALSERPIAKPPAPSTMSEKAAGKRKVHFDSECTEYEYDLEAVKKRVKSQDDH